MAKQMRARLKICFQKNFGLGHGRWEDGKHGGMERSVPERNMAKNYVFPNQIRRHRNKITFIHNRGAKRYQNANSKHERKI